MPPLPPHAVFTGEKDSSGGTFSQNLTEAELNRVFEATSSFSIRDAYEDLHPFLGMELLSEEEEHSDDELVSDSDEDFQLTDKEPEDEELIMKPRVARQRRLGGKGKLSNQTMLQQNDDFLHFRPKQKLQKNGSQLIHLQLPHPHLPISWGRTVQPYGTPLDQDTDLEKTESKSCSFPDLLAADYSMFFRKFLGVMINPQWCERTDPLHAKSLLAQLPIQKICVEGFLFIWIPKTYLQSVWSVLSSWKFTYVENLTWIHLKPNNKVRKDQDNENWVIPRSHISLYIFRKGGKEIEIKHQRSSDLIFDVYLPNQEFHVPEEVYHVIETMLPNAAGKLIEFWAGKNSKRATWVHIHEA